MKRATIAALVIAVMAGACAPRTVIPPAPAGLRYPDFVYPAPPERAGDPRTRSRHEAAWSRLQSGDLRTAEAAFTDLLTQHPSFFPAAVGWGYVLVAGGKSKEALARFEQALRQAPRYAPALAGRAEAWLAAGQRDSALVGFEAALSADGTLSDVRRRIDVLKFDRVRERIAVAKRAADAGRLDDARDAYAAAIAASPESAFLYRDLGFVEVRRNDLPAAEKDFRRALALDPGDVRACLGLADVLEKHGDVNGAIVALERAYTLDPSDAVKLRLDRARERDDARALPTEYAEIPGLAQVTRGDLAALVGVRLRAIIAASRSRSSVVATDIREHWASTWIVGVIRSGVMDVFPNHTFQPLAVVRRADLAQVVSRVLASAEAGGARPVRGKVQMGDVGTDHLNYADIAAAVAAGVLALDAGQFRPARVVSGQEAIDAIKRLERIVSQARSGNR